MTSLRIVIADDELPARGALRCLLRAIPGADVAAECRDGEETVRYLAAHPETDLLFLDIEMPGLSGLEAARRIRACAPDTRIAFATGYSQFAVESFELEAFDYLLKPYRRDRVAQTVRRLLRQKEEAAKKQRAGEILLPASSFALRSEGRVVFLDPAAEIVFVAKEKTGCTRFYTTRGIFSSRLLLRDAEARLAAAGFFRTHRSYLINPRFLLEAAPWFNDTCLAVMKGYEEEEVPISRSYLKAFRQRFGLTPRP